MVKIFGYELDTVFNIIHESDVELERQLTSPFFSTPPVVSLHLQYQFTFTLQYQFHLSDC